MDPPPPPQPAFTDDQLDQCVLATTELATDLSHENMWKFEKLYLTNGEAREWDAEKTRIDNTLEDHASAAVECLGGTNKLRLTVKYSIPAVTLVKPGTEGNLSKSKIDYRFESIYSNGFATVCPRSDMLSLPKELVHTPTDGLVDVSSSGYVYHDGQEWHQVME